MTDEVAPPQTGLARQALAGLRLQEFGHSSPARVLDPIVEPLWTGIRTLAAVGDGDVALVDIDGDAVGGFDEITKALGIAVAWGEIVVEGYITKQASHQARAVAAWSDEMPTMSSFIGLRRNRALDATKFKEQALAETTFDPDDLLSFVATDLLCSSAAVSSRASSPSPTACGSERSSGRRSNAGSRRGGRRASAG
jgi:hypothetical protein